MIGTRVEVEYEENVDRVVKYLGWIPLRARLWITIKCTDILFNFRMM